MKQGGRPRRSEERPDSAFGIRLKQHLGRVVGFTQAQLSRESLVAEKTISVMVKGERTDGPKFRQDLRAIIRVLYQKQALLTLEEANALIMRIPTEGPLDERDAEDAALIKLLQPPVPEEEPYIAPHRAQDTSSEDPKAAEKQEDDSAEPKSATLLSQLDSVSSSEDQEDTPVQIEPARVLSSGGQEKIRARRWWETSSGLLAILLVLALLLLVVRQFAFSLQTMCPLDPHGVTLYNDLNEQGQCHTFAPGSYELAKYGLGQSVSSIRDPHNAYHIKLFDKAKNFADFDKDTPTLPAEWDKRADTVLIEKHRPTACNPGTDGIIAFINTDYAGGCLFITGDIADLTPLNFDSDIVSIQFVGRYLNTHQLVIYKQPGYRDKCGAYWQDQSDLLQCARIALSLRVLPFAPPTPIPGVAGTRYSGNVAPYATLSPTGSGAVIDGSLQTEWLAGHMVEVDLRWPVPVTIQRVVVWDRKQSATDNNQINKLKLFFSDGTMTGSLDMVSGGPRCVDVTFLAKTVTWLRIQPVDASGNNGYREVEVWATTGPQYANITCVNKKMVTQTIPVV